MQNSLVEFNDNFYTKYKKFDFKWLTNEEGIILHKNNPKLFDNYLDDVVEYYQKDYGFPLDSYVIDSEYRIKNFLKLCDFNEESIYSIDDDKKKGLIFSKNKETSFIGTEGILPNMLCYEVCNSYFPHKIDVKSKGFATARDKFDDALSLKKCISKCYLIFKSDARPSKVFSLLKIFSGVQSVSNFRPTAAKLIYRMFLPKEGGKIWDMSMGWGGRMFGALSLDRVIEYHGTDPSTKNIQCYENIKKELDIKKRVFNHCQGSETFVKEKYFDLCFTSPPYFNTEEYSNDETQSFKKFDNKVDWREKYLRQTLKNCYLNLKDERYCVINIANIPAYKNLVADTVVVAKEEGFKFVKTVNYYLALMCGSGKDKNTSKFKSEPALVFYKGNTPFQHLYKSSMSIEDFIQ